jgi:hypothetical protein
MLKMDPNGKLLPMLIQVRRLEYLTPNTVLCSPYLLPLDRDPGSFYLFISTPDVTQ